MTQIDTDEKLRQGHHYCPDKIGIQKQSESRIKRMTRKERIIAPMLLDAGIGTGRT